MPRHGGSDPGAVNGNIKEKDFNLQAANYIYERLNELGVPVAITRIDDEDIGRSERLRRMVNSFGNDKDVIILSNHINAGGGEGAEVVYSLRNDDTLSKMILDEIGNAGQIERKVYQRRLPENPSKDYYYIMRETPNTEAVLIEYGFIDNPRDLYKLQNNLYDYAEGVVKAVTNYIGVPYIPKEETIVDTNTYIVKSGDTLYSIARAYNTTVDELKRINRLSNNVLSIGQTLLIPETEEELQSDYLIYTVKKGDTLYSIARAFNVTVDEIITLNRLNSIGLSIGQQLLIPENGIQIIGVVDYTIKPGDSLWKIANRCGATVDDIVKLNNLDSTIIYPGQIIKLSEPCAAKQNYEEYETYIVKRGDTLYSISKMFNTTPSVIKELNNLNTDMLQINQMLILPKENV
ncbi:MAG: LysM peptidoglycan-binding domain-containing protein [Bacilli bacterium]|nr:LysM peptidoglycan-binding domain-containing protein [Bacilli bacterium]